MKYVSYSGKKDIELLPCPFCGCEPIEKHIGNNHTKIRKIVIKCPQCRCQRTDAALRNGFEWLEEISAMNWNQRPNIAKAGVK